LYNFFADLNAVKTMILKFSFYLFTVLVTLIFLNFESQNSTKNKFADPIHIKIADFQDRRLTDSLYQYFNSNNVNYRRDALLAFASIQDSMAVERIGKVLLADSDAKVREAAAYALGQTSCNASFQILAKSFRENKNLSEAVIEAIGKTAKGNFDILNGEIKESAWAYYRFGLSNKISDAEVRRCLRYFDGDNDTLNLKAVVHLFARTKALNDAAPSTIKIAEQKLIKVLKNADPEIRMAAVYALRKIQTDSSLNTILEIAKKDEDYRVRVNAVRSLQSFPFEKTKQALFHALNDQQINVNATASDVIKQKIAKDSWKEVLDLAQRHKNRLTQASLYEAVLSVNDNKKITAEIKNLYKAATDSYAKAALITALQQSIVSYEFISNEMLTTKIPAIRTAAVASLVAINQRKNFNKKLLSPRFAEIYVKAIGLGDAAVIGTISTALADSTLEYRMLINDFSFLINARKKLTLPKDFEAIQPLEGAIAYFENRKPAKLKNEFNHPIDWTVVKSIAVNQQAVIKTEKGNIVLKLLVEEAPGSVANFLALVSKKYYDHKIFHRVVPNFVVQAGCKRGDGWGSENYSIRSEFSGRDYRTGSVGMASAGKDTEGTQWFITHSPAPHLDGRYTIFAEVIEGMQVVHQLEIGDEILEVRTN
jgi:cyclophilin family peptidyl-prolyl cis-trans isomerase/HEAT repeat protein